MRRWRFALAAIALAAVFACAMLTRGQAQEGSSQPTLRLAKSRIDKVTVYPTNALITREVEVPAGAGLIELIIAPMPDQIVPSTMYSEGSEGLRVLTTRFSTRQVMEDTSEERRKLEAEKEKYDVSAARIASEIASAQKNIEMLTKMEGVAEKGKYTGDEVIAMAKY